MARKYKITDVGTGYFGMSIAVMSAQQNELTARDIDEDQSELINGDALFTRDLLGSD